MYGPRPSAVMALVESRTPPEARRRARRLEAAGSGDAARGAAASAEQDASATPLAWKDTQPLHKVGLDCFVPPSPPVGAVLSLLPDAEQPRSAARRGPSPAASPPARGGSGGGRRSSSSAGGAADWGCGYDCACGGRGAGECRCWRDDCEWGRDDPEADTASDYPEEDDSFDGGAAGSELHLEPPCAFPPGAPRYQLLRRLGQARMGAGAGAPPGAHAGAGR
jgi:hypothetical protein